MSGSGSPAKLGSDFKVAAKPKPCRRKRTPPVSIRFSDEERAWLEKRAGSVPVSRYIKDAVLSGSGVKRKPKRQSPVKDHKALARVLSALGRSEIPRTLNYILALTEAGSSMRDMVIEQEMHWMRDDVAAMRADLLKALGLDRRDAS